MRLLHFLQRAAEALALGDRCAGRRPHGPPEPDSPVPSGDGRTHLSALILPELEARVARIHRTLDAIEARGAARLAELQGRRPVEAAALTAFADRPRATPPSQGTPDA